jgi:hypothetical protein
MNVKRFFSSTMTILVLASLISSFSTVESASAATFVGSFVAKLPDAPGGELEVSFSIPNYEPFEPDFTQFSQDISLKTNINSTDPAQYIQYDPGGLIIRQFPIGNYLDGEIFLSPNDFAADIDTSVPGGEVDVSFAVGEGPNKGALESATTTLQSGIPEPEVWTFMLTGICVAGVALRRKRELADRVENGIPPNRSLIQDAAAFR